MSKVLDIAKSHSEGRSYGPLQQLLDDPNVEEIWVNEPSRVFAARAGRAELTTVVMSADMVRNVVERMLSPTGRRVDLANPFVDAMLPDGSRLHVAIPDITRDHWAINIRKFTSRTRSLADLVNAGTLTSAAADYLDTCVRQGRNVVVAGGTQAGKTTLMNALLNAIPADERVVTCEEVFELRLTVPDWVALQTRQPGLDGMGEIPLRRLIKEALRMRPTRLVVGEVRQEECLDLLIAMNAGMPGMCSIHANSARDAVMKMTLLPLLAGASLSPAVIVPTVAAVVDVVVHIARDSSGARRVRQISEVPGRCEGAVIEMQDVFHTSGGQLVATSGSRTRART